MIKFSTIRIHRIVDHPLVLFIMDDFELYETVIAESNGEYYTAKVAMGVSHNS